MTGTYCTCSHPFLIPLSSFPMDVTLLSSLKLLDMTHQRAATTEVAMTELVIAGFGKLHTAYLARAALARLQEQFGIATVDMAMVLRGADGGVSVQQTLNRDARRNGSSAYWEILADLFIIPDLQADAATGATAEKCATIGVDPAFASSLSNQLRLCESVVLVRTRDLAQREKVVGLLQGFDGEVLRVPLRL
jgi:uncharacterized membrane protein